MKSLINKRKKSVPESEISLKTSQAQPQLHYHHHHHYDATAVSSELVAAASSPTSTTTYNIFLNESCSVEVTAAQQTSTVQHLLGLILQKIKVNGDLSEYCLVEHLEFEQILAKQVSISAAASNSSSSQPRQQQQQQQQQQTSNSITNLANEGSNQNKKLIVKTRILGAKENLFILSHVWKKMKEDRKDGFKYAKIILTKRKAITTALMPTHFENGASGSALQKQASLAKHRMSLQPSNNLSATKLASDLIIPASRPLAQRAAAAMAVTQKRAKSSLHRLVRQKSFEESLEDLDASITARHLKEKNLIACHGGSGNSKNVKELAVASSHSTVVNDDFTCVMTTTTTTDDLTVDGVGEGGIKRRMSGVKVTEVIESTTEILVQKEEGEVVESGDGAVGSDAAEAKQADETDDEDEQTTVIMMPEDDSVDDHEILAVAGSVSKNEADFVYGEDKGGGGATAAVAVAAASKSTVVKSTKKQSLRKQNTVQRFFKLKF